MKKICVLILILFSGFAFTGIGNSKNKKNKKKDETHVTTKTIIKSYDFYTEPNKIKPNNELIDKLPLELWYVIFGYMGAGKKDHEGFLLVSKYTRDVCRHAIYFLNINDIELLLNEKLKELILKYPNLIDLTLKQTLFVKDKFEKLIMEYYPNIDNFALPIYNNSLCLEFLSDIENLQALSLCCTYYLEDNDLKQLSNIKNLKSLTLSGSNIFELKSRITDKGLGYLSDLKNLKGLSLSCQNINSNGFQKLGDLTNLESLSLMFEEFKESFNHIGKLTNLKNLSFYCCEITDENFKHISKLTNLQYLKIGEIADLTDRGIGYLSSLINLRHLTLEKLSTKVTEVGLDQLNHLSNLRYIETIDCDKYLVWQDNTFKTTNLKSRKKE